MPNEDSIDDRNFKDLTPMMKHWYSVKQNHKDKYPDHIIAYRMGDFYEFFYEDAVRVSKLLGITLTKRKVGSDAYPLAGIPHHAGNYLKNLVNLGQTVVVVDQLEDPATVKGRIVKRGVVRILSPGTITEPDMLKSNENNYICSIVKERNGFGIAFVDLSTGEFFTTEFLKKEQDPFEKILSTYSQYDPVELIVPTGLKKDERLFMLLSDLNDALIKTYEDSVFEFDESYDLLKRHFNISNLNSFDLESSELAVQASGGLLAFLKETQRDVIPNLFKINYIREENLLHIDYITQRNLELVNSLWEKGRDFTLYSIFNQTHTPMGSRLLKKIILQPLTDLNEINQRINIVQKFKDDVFLRSELREELKVIGDLERFINRINYARNSNARELINIKYALERIPKIKNLLEKTNIPEISKFNDNIKDFQETRTLIDVSMKDNPPTTVKEGNLIKTGFNDKIDELRDILQNGKNYILEYEKTQKDRWKLNSGFKVGHNNILGYYIQITLRTLKEIPKIPDEYVERQTLKNAKRYTTSQLKKLEEKIVQAEEQINELEYEVFSIIREKVIGKTLDILETAINIAFIDVFACFAEVAEKYNYCKPKMNTEDIILIKEGRHPVVEQINMSERFIPNDCYLDTNKEQILIITGPNMAGKCVSPNTLIFTERGILPIVSFKPNNIKKESFEEINLKLVGLNGIVDASHYYYDGVRSTIHISTRRGYEIEGTPNHPILIRSKDGVESWKRLADVTSEDFIIINRRNDLWGKKVNISYNIPDYPNQTKKYTIPTKITEDFAYILGLLIGDGTLTYDNSYILTTKDKYIQDEYVRIHEDIFNYTPGIKTNKKDVFVSSKFLRDFLFSLGFDYVQAHQKLIPELILKTPKYIIIAFLQGLFDSDGYAGKRYGNVTYSTTSKKLATQVHLVLLNFGIVSSLKSKNTAQKDLYEVRISGKDSIEFYNKIGFRLPRKKERRGLASEIRMTNIDSIPYLNKTLFAIKERYLEKAEQISKEHKLKYNKKISSIFDSYIRQGRNISYSKLQDLIQYCILWKIPHHELQIIYDNYYFYDKIESIQKSKSEVYDFTIPKRNAFIGNGIINHNSTYLRQVALICIIAQMGCFVPAKSANLGIIDHIFTRIGASDDLARKLSTFMIEMTETAKILNFATQKSLVIIDELGRGTSTSDGQSIALATLEKLHELKAKTLFSTHYHQLTEIDLPRVKNYHLDIIENDDGSINFIRKLKLGSTDKSYGIHVAKIAGIPDDVIIRAFEILDQIEVKDPFKATVKNNGNEVLQGKYHDKFILEKQMMLDRLNSALELRQNELSECEDEMILINKELVKKKSELQNIPGNIAKSAIQLDIRQRNDVKKEKKYVQTTFFKPEIMTETRPEEDVKELLKIVNDIELESLTPVEAMKKLIILKEKLSKLKINYK